MTTDSLLWGIDLGETKIEVALCDPVKPAEALLRRRCDTAAHLGYEQILARISSLVAEAEKILRPLLGDSAGVFGAALLSAQRS